MKPRILFLSLKFLLALVAISLCRQTSAATFPVTDGDVAALITAINTSNSNGEDDTIELATNGTYTLTTVNNGINGLPVIGSDTAHKLVIQGNGATLQRSFVSGTPSFRIFQIGAGADVTISGLTIMHGNADNGGCIYNNATLTVNSSTISGNFASSGAGIYNDQATLTVINSTIRGNTAYPGDGGAIYNTYTTLKVINSTINSNYCRVRGAGIYNNDFSGFTTLTVANSTFSNNLSDGTQDSIYNGTNCWIANSTFSEDPGIRNIPNNALIATVTVTNSTFSNSRIFNSNGNGLGRVVIGHTIINQADIQTVGFAQITSRGHNLSSGAAGGDGTTGPGGFLNATGDIRNTNPLLGPLQDNGGPTFMYSLSDGSPAIDAGTDLTALNSAIDDTTTGVTVTDATGIPAGVGFAIQIDSEQMIVDAKSANTLTVTRGANSTTPAAHSNGAAVNPAFDQRDSDFARKVGSAVDIGAFEVQASPTPTPTPSPTPSPHLRRRHLLHRVPHQLRHLRQLPRQRTSP